jgi:hypothetical protein
VTVDAFTFLFVSSVSCVFGSVQQQQQHYLLTVTLPVGPTHQERQGVCMPCTVCVAWRGVAWRGVAWRGVAWRGVAWRGVAWRGVAWRGAATLIGFGCTPWLCVKGALGAT